MENEQVLVIPNYCLNKLLDNQEEYVPFVADDMDSLIESKSFFMDRAEAEYNFDNRQIIPYIVIKNRENKILLYQRLSGGGESRLHDRYSIGIGGHVNPVDSDDKLYSFQLSSLYNCIYREIEEEVYLKNDDIISKIRHDIDYQIPNKIGYILSNHSDVEKVHLGIVYEVQLNVPNATIVSGEDESLAISGWYDLNNLRLNKDNKNYEKWTELVISHI